MTSKTHYRKVFKSDHLGSADLEDFIESGSNLIFTISHVKQEYGARVAGKKGDFNIAYFKENIKPFVLNAGNSAIIKGFSGGSAFVEDWKNIPITLYVDKNVKYRDSIVSGVRVHPKQPRLTKPSLTKDMAAAWKNAKNAFLRDGNLEKVMERFDISSENKKEIMKECSSGAV